MTGKNSWDIERDDTHTPPPKKKSNFIGAMGNFSVQYNMQCLSIAIAFMQSHSDTVLPSKPLPDTPTADYPEPAWAKNSLLAMVFAGSVVGMFSMGYIGDLLGRRIGMILTLSFVVFGALCASLLSWGNAESVYGILTFCRFIIGVGVGGIYPMAAATAAEGTSKGENHGERVGWAFFWQAPGAMAPYVVAYFLTFIPADTPNVTSIQFRILLALGALPASIVWVASFFSASDSPRKTGNNDSDKKNPLQEALEHPQYFKTLIGTGGTWFLYDVAYYGTSIFTPQILKSIFGAEDSLVDLCWQSLAVSSMGIPALIISILLIKRLGGKYLNLFGFILIAILFAALAFCYIQSTDGLSSTKFAVFCLLTFALNWGVQVGTYITPAIVYPPQVRTTFHGLSAASGKLGAVTGTIIFSLVDVSNPTIFLIIMWFLVVVSLIGAVVTYFFVPDTRNIENDTNNSDEDDDRTALLEA